MSVATIVLGVDDWKRIADALGGCRARTCRGIAQATYDAIEKARLDGEAFITWHVSPHLVGCFEDAARRSGVAISVDLEVENGE